MELLRLWKEHRKVTRAHLKMPAPGKYICIPQLPKSHLKKFGKKTVTVYEEDVNDRTFVSKFTTRMSLWEKFDPVDGVKQATKIIDDKQTDKNFWWREEFIPDTIIDVTKSTGIMDDGFDSIYEDKAWGMKWDSELKAAFESFNRNAFVMSKDSRSLLHQPSKCIQIDVKGLTTTLWASVLSGRAAALYITVQGPSRAFLTPFLCLRNVTTDIKNLRYRILLTNNWNPSCLLQLLTRSAEEQRSVVNPDVGLDQRRVQSLITKRCFAICRSGRSPKTTGCQYDEGHATWRQHFLDMPWKPFVAREIYERFAISNISNQDTKMTTSALCEYFTLKCCHVLLQTFPFGSVAILRIQIGTRQKGQKYQVTTTSLTRDQTTKGVTFNRFSERHSVTEESPDLLKASEKTETITSEKNEAVKRSKPRRKGFLSRMWRGLKKIWTRRRTSK